MNINLLLFIDLSQLVELLRYSAPLESYITWLENIFQSQVEVSNMTFFAGTRLFEFHQIVFSRSIL